MFNGTSLQPSKVVYVELTLQSVNEIRKQERRKEKQVRALKDVHCYDWKTLVEKGEFDMLYLYAGGGGGGYDIFL